MTWFKKDHKPIEATPNEERRVKTEGLWIKCDGCRSIIWKKDLEANWEVCPKCGNHFRLGAKRRLELLLDDGKWIEYDAELASTDPLKFVDTKPYSQRLREAQNKLGVNDAILSVEGQLNGRPGVCLRRRLHGCSGWGESDARGGAQR